MLHTIQLIESHLITKQEVNDYLFHAQAPIGSHGSNIETS